MANEDAWGEERNQRLVVEAVEARVTSKTTELRQQLHALVDKIVVRDFRVEDGHVVWTVHVPPTLLTLVHHLPEALSPHG